jgi:hypothetical protein
VARHHAEVAVHEHRDGELADVDHERGGLAVRLQGERAAVAIEHETPLAEDAFPRQRRTVDRPALRPEDEVAIAAPDQIDRGRVDVENRVLRLIEQPAVGPDARHGHAAPLIHPQRHVVRAVGGDGRRELARQRLPDRGGTQRHLAAEADGGSGGRGNGDQEKQGGDSVLHLVSNMTL